MSISKNILNTNKHNIPLKLSKELYDYVHKEDGNFYTELNFYNNGKIESAEGEENTELNKSGVIILPVPRNSIEMNKDQLSKYLIKNLNTIENYLFKEKNIETILQKDDVFVGYSIGNIFNGRYHSRNGQLYSNDSIAIELINLDFDEIVSVADNLKKEMNLESILVKDNSSFKMIYID